MQAWLGHKTPQSTAHYAKITPNKLSEAYRDAGYFGRNLRTIEVLLDRDAVASGATATGQPWQYYDLGHGYCTYTFFEQCQHRMACARCDFYPPKQSSRALLLEAKTNLQRMLVSIPLTDDERAAVDDGEQAVDQFLQRLAEVPAPAGPPSADTATRGRANQSADMILLTACARPARARTGLPEVDGLEMSQSDLARMISTLRFAMHYRQVIARCQPSL